MDRFFRSWDLVMKSFGVLMSDKELLVFPISSAIGCVTVSVWIGSVFAFTYPQQLSALAEAGPHRPALTQEMWICLFFLYLANYFIVVFFNVGLVCAASDRLAGGHASINQGLQVAWARKGKIFQWALVAATFGILMNMVEKRAGWLGRLIARMIGAAWNLATFFVVPLLAAEDIGPVDAFHRSADLFKQTWGEEVVGGFSFGLIFVMLSIPGIALPFFLGRAFGPTGVMAGFAMMVVYWLLLSAISSAVHGIFMAALYRYATTKKASATFGLGDFSSAWQPKP